MPPDHDRDVITYVGLPEAAELFDPAVATEYGWAVPVGGQTVGYVYVGLADISFEVWLGGDSDLALKIARPFSFGPGDHPRQLDPRTARKADLAALLDLSHLHVERFLVRRSGLLEIVLDGGWGLAVDPADDGQAWSMAWPVEGPSVVTCPPGGGVRLGDRNEFSIYPADDGTPPPDPASLEPRREGSLVMLPIRGLVAQAAASGVSIDLAVPIPGGGMFDMHFGGSTQVRGAPGGDWTGDARGAAVLDLVGATVVAAQMDEAERLRLRFDDGRTLIAEPDTWEAYWPLTRDGIDHWAPHEGPRIP